MLNAMPLPVGPKEIHSSAAKPEAQQKSSNGAQPGEDNASFVSTLEAAHKDRQTTEDKNTSAKGNMSGEKSPSTREEPAPGKENPIVVPEGVFNLMTTEAETTHKNTDINLISPSSEINTGSETMPALTETDVLNKMKGYLSKSDTTANPAASRQDAVKITDATKGTDGTEPESEIQLPKTGNTPRTAVENVKTGKPELGGEQSQTVREISHQASQIVEETPERKIAQTLQRNTVDGAMKQQAALGDTLVKSNLDEGEPQLSSKDQSATSLLRMNAGSKHSGLEGSSPDKPKMEPLEFSTVRSQVSDPSIEKPKASVEKGSETPTPVMTDETGPMTSRPAGNDSNPSLFTTPVIGKGITAPAPTAMTSEGVTAEVFARDNFNQLVERALFTVRGEQSEARIALKPDHLGHVQMKIVTENNVVSVRIVAETPMARDLIDANANQLKAELQHQGLNVETIEVSVSDDPHDAYRQARQRESLLRHMNAKGEESVEEDGEAFENGPNEPKKNRNSASGIDYFA